MSQQRNLVIKQEETVIAALAKLTPDANLPVGGQPTASKDLQTQLQAHVDTMNSLSDAHAKVAQLVAQEKSQKAAVTPILSGIRNYAAGQYGEKSPEFASFGFTPKKQGIRTVETKASAVEKQLATRVARHTMGKRQRAAIHGVPASPPATGPVVSPPATGPVVSPPATVAPIAASTAAPTAAPSPVVATPTDGVSTQLVNGAAH